MKRFSNLFVCGGLLIGVLLVVAMSQQKLGIGNIGVIHGPELETILLDSGIYQYDPDAPYTVPNRGHYMGTVSNGADSFRIYSVRGTKEYIYLKLGKSGSFYRCIEPALERWMSSTNPIPVLPGDTSAVFSAEDYTSFSLDEETPTYISPSFSLTDVGMGAFDLSWEPADVPLQVDIFPEGETATLQSYTNGQAQGILPELPAGSYQLRISRLDSDDTTADTPVQGKLAFHCTELTPD